MGIGQARGKLLLFGEHAAVYGHVAVGVSLSERLTVRLEGDPSSDWVLDLVAEEDRAVVAQVLQRMEARLAGAVRRRTVRIQSAIPRGLGFGSSAALCVAFARALLQDSGGDARATGSAWALAHDAEHLFHGTPSGVDTGISLLRGTCVLRPRSPGLPEYSLVPNRGVALVAGAVRRDESCAALIGGLAARMRAGDAVVKASIEELGRLSLRAAEVLQSAGDRPPAAALGELADTAMATLRRLGLSTPDLDHLLETARRAGALGGKLSGAGGGGAFYVVAEDAKAASRLADRLGAAASAAGFELVGGLRIIET